MMNFDEWLKSNPNTDKLTWEEDLQKAWDTAINEAAAVVFKCGESEHTHNLIEEIRKLK